MPALTGTQREELLSAVATFIESEGWADAAKAIRMSLSDETPLAKLGTLERRWTTTHSLQKKLMGLEAEKQKLLVKLKKCGEVENSDSSTGGGVMKLPSPAVLRTFSLPSVQCVACHPAEALIACGAADGAVMTWDVGSGGGMKHRMSSIHKDAISCLQWHSAGVLLGCGGMDGMCTVFSVENEAGTCSASRIFHGHDDAVVDLCWMDGFMVSCARDRTIRVWSVETGAPTLTLKSEDHSDWPRQVVAIAGTGFSYIACSLGKDITCWSTASGKSAGLMVGHTQMIECLRVAPKECCDVLLASRAVVSGGRDGTVRVWTIPDGICMCVIDCKQGWLRACLFLGSVLCTAGDNGSILFWKLWCVDKSLDRSRSAAAVRLRKIDEGCRSQILHMGVIPSYFVCLRSADGVSLRALN